MPVKWAIAARWSGMKLPVTTLQRMEETTLRLKGMVQGVTVGQGAKGSDRSRAPSCDCPAAPRRRQTAGQVGAV